jgi:hypothetical protein
MELVPRNSGRASLIRNGFKKCPCCGYLKPAFENFYAEHNREGDGLSGYCKKCKKAKAIQWQKAKRDRSDATTSNH